MEHYEHLIIKGLINCGGSSSESYVYQLLTGDVNDNSSSVARMWGYLDAPLQSKLATILDDVCGVSIVGLSDAEVVNVLTEYMADKGGRQAFFKNNSRNSIERMSDEEYEKGIKLAIQEKRDLLAMKA